MLKELGRESEVTQHDESKIFSDDINEIITLILLFYQNGPIKSFPKLSEALPGVYR